MSTKSVHRKGKCILFSKCYTHVQQKVQQPVLNNNGNSKIVVTLMVHTLLSTSLQSIWDWTMYMRESTNPVHSLSFLLASLRSELTFLKQDEKRENATKPRIKNVK